jgi:hypothetical protein
MTKTCLICAADKPTSDFYKGKSPGSLRAYCKTCDNAKRMEWRKANKERDTAINNKSRKTPEFKAKARKYRREYRKANPVIKYRLDLSSRIANHIRLSGYGHKTAPLEKILGCTFEDLDTHLILSAISRYGVWLSCDKYHVDHIYPIGLATSVEEVEALNHFSNLQLLTPNDNHVKGCRI